MDLKHIFDHFENLTEEEFDELFIIYVSDQDKECSICFENMKEYVKTPCNHCFHKDCLSKWFFKSNNCLTNCPMCRTRITNNNKKYIKKILELFTQIIEVNEQSE